MVWATGGAARVDSRRGRPAGGKELTGYEPCLTWLPPPAPCPGRKGGPGAAGPVRDRRVPGAVGRPDAAHPAGTMDVLHHSRRPDQKVLDLAGVPGAADRDRHCRHPLRHPLVQAGHRVAGRVSGHLAGPGRARRPLCAGVLRRRLHHQPAHRRHYRRPGLGRLQLRRRPARSRARRPGPAAGATPVLLEERQMGAGPGTAGCGSAGLLGDLRLSHVRRPMARTALRGRLTWQATTVASVTRETASVCTIGLEPPDWPGHRAGQHLEVRLTAEDGYRAERQYSIASAPGEPVAITVQRLEDGEVSPYLTEELRAGDKLDVRGPIGGYFVWEPGDDGPLMLLAGGSGIVPLRSMLRHRQRTGSVVPARLLYSSRTLPDVIYRDELDQCHGGVQVIYTLTRGQPPGWTGHTGRV